MLQKFNERNRDLVVNIGGKLLHRDEAGVSPFDSVVQGGDAVWEGLRLYRGAHLQTHRASQPAAQFGPRDGVPGHPYARVHHRRDPATLEANGMLDGVHIRLTLTRGVKITSGMDPRLNQSGPTLIVLAEHKAAVYDTGGLRLMTSSVRRFPPDCLDPKIHHNNLLQSILAKIEANAAGADDALMLDVRGFVAETNATHVFIVKERAVSTSRTIACPEGITRATVLDLCGELGISSSVRDLSLAEVYAADEMFCTGTMGEIAAVTSVDGRTIGSGQPGPVTGQLAGEFRQLTARSGEDVVTAH